MAAAQSTSEILRPETNEIDSIAPDAYRAVDIRDELRRALRTLTPRCRAVIVLRYFNDMDDATIAAILGVKPATVRSLAHRGLKALRPLIAHATTDANHKESR